MQKRIRRALGFLGIWTVAITCLANVDAANWAQWRGPNFDGSSPEKNLPATFSRSENVGWVAPLPGPSAATPIVWADHVFINSVDRDTRTLQALAFDRVSGKLRWAREVGQGVGQDGKSNYSSPSPATDGELVIFFYGNGDLAAFDFSGKKLWARNIQKDYGQFAFQWTFSTSPLLFQGRLYLQVLQRNKPVNGRGRTEGSESYLLALEPKTGRELWRQVRPAEAREESLEAFSTPIPWSFEGRSEILVAGGDCISGHAPDTGAELWRWGTWNPTRITHWRLVPSPVAGAGVILACAPKGAPIFAVKAGLKGTLDDSSLAWKSSEREISSDVSTPLFYQGRFYILNSDRKSLSCVDPASGKVFWTGATESKSKFEASPTAADGKIYMMNFRGDVHVAAAGNEFKILHIAAMGDDGDDNLRSSVAIAGGQLFVRTGGKLYCLAKLSSQ